MRCEKSVAHRLCEAAATYCRSVQLLERPQCALPPWLPQAVRLLRTLSEAPEQLVALNTLRDNPGATHSVSVRICWKICCCCKPCLSHNCLAAQACWPGNRLRPWQDIRPRTQGAKGQNRCPWEKSNMCLCRGLTCKPQSLMLCISNLLLLEACAQLRPESQAWV